MSHDACDKCAPLVSQMQAERDEAKSEERWWRSSRDEAHAAREREKSAREDAEARLAEATRLLVGVLGSGGAAHFREIQRFIGAAPSESKPSEGGER